MDCYRFPRSLPRLLAVGFSAIEPPLPYPAQHTGRKVTARNRRISSYFGRFDSVPDTNSTVRLQNPTRQPQQCQQVKSSHGKAPEGQQAAGGGMRLAALARGGEGRASLSGGEIRSVRDWELVKDKHAAASDIHGPFSDINRLVVRYSPTRKPIFNDNNVLNADQATFCSLSFVWGPLETQAIA